MSFFANIFGYILNFFYELIGNYGIAIILFSIILKIQKSLIKRQWIYIKEKI